MTRRPKTRWQKFCTGDFDADWVLVGMFGAIAIVLILIAVFR